ALSEFTFHVTMRTPGKVPRVPDHPITPTAGTAAPGATLQGTVRIDLVAEEPATAPTVGPNEWLVDEMYEQFLADPSSVSASWQEFFADYRPATAAAATPAPTLASAPEPPPTNGQA